MKKNTNVNGGLVIARVVVAFVLGSSSLALITVALTLPVREKITTAATSIPPLLAQPLSENHYSVPNIRGMISMSQWLPSMAPAPINAACV